MKNKGIILFLIVLAVVIVAVMVGDFMSKRPNKSEANPYEYNIDEFKNVDPNLILYKETKNLKVGFEEPSAITVVEGKIYVAGDLSLKIIDFSGKLVNEIKLPEKPHTVEVTNNRIFVAFKKKVIVFTKEGNKLNGWELSGENSYITSMVAKNGYLFVADAGTRKVIRFTENGEEINEFEGKKDDNVIHGFIVPSPYFDIDINDDDELWVVNPGMHAFENYTFEGNLRAYWENASMKTDGFSGCCNPAHFTFLSDGSFVTSEKGLVRVKIHKPSGELLGVVAAPVKFENEDEAPDVAVDSLGNIYALDFHRKMVRIFEPK